MTLRHSWTRWLTPWAVLVVSLTTARASTPPGDTLPKDALDALFQEAESQQSNGLVVYQREQLVREKRWTRDRRLPIYSVTKVLAGLAVGIAWDKGLIPSINEPVSRWYPEISGDPMKSQIRIRHLLDHTSGILTTQGSKDIYPQIDFVTFALQSDVVTPPGHVYRYNNRAINVASGIVRKASGQSMNEFLIEHLFKPLGIENFRLHTDRAGNGWGMDGAQLLINDLAKIGTVLANGGRYKDRQIISQRWLDIAFQASLVTLDGSASYGLGLFALDLDGGLEIPPSTVETLERSGLRSDLAKRLLPYAGREFPKAKDLGKALKSEFNPSELEEISSAGGQAMIPIYRNIRGRKMIAHSGEIGIILIAVPEFGISVARTIDESRGRNKPHGFDNIYSRVFKLLPPLAPALPAPE